MTYLKNTTLTPAEQKRLVLVEEDVKRAMKEAIESRMPKKGPRVLLATQLARLILTVGLLSLSACAWRVEGDWYGRTAKDFRSYTEVEKPIQNPKGRY